MMPDRVKEITNEELVKALRGLLKRAQAGEIVGVAAAAITADPQEFITRAVCDPREAFRLCGAVSLLDKRIALNLLTTAEEQDLDG